jgi:hypothetical protein
MSREGCYEDFGKAELVAGPVEVDFVVLLGIEDGSYHVTRHGPPGYRLIELRPL